MGYHCLFDWIGFDLFVALHMHCWAGNNSALSAALPGRAAVVSTDELVTMTRGDCDTWLILENAIIVMMSINNDSIAIVPSGCCLLLPLLLLLLLLLFRHVGKAMAVMKETLIANLLHRIK